jgi:hypothetical protein
MLEIITPSVTIGWLSWELFEKCIASRDKMLVDAIKTMIGFRIDEGESAYYYGEINDDGKLQYSHCGAYETRTIEPNAKVFYTHEELVETLATIFKQHKKEK